MSHTDGMYVLYRGDDVIDIGTCSEIAERQGVKPGTIYYYSTKAHCRKVKDSPHRLLSVRVEE